MLTVIGDLIADVVVLGSFPYAIGTDNPAVITHTRGGSAANVAAAAASSMPVRFIGRVGADAEGDALAHALAGAGVDVRVQREGRTGSIVILVDAAAERTMLTDRGAAAELDEIDPAWLEGTSWLHLPLYGFVAGVSRAALMHACGWARERSVPLSIDMSSTDAMARIGADAVEEILAEASPAVVFANADEARVLDDWRVARPVDAIVAIKRGADPVVLRTRGGEVQVAVDPVDDVVDSTGAGDAFAAGYIAAAMAGAPPTECAKAGAASARGALRRPGAL